jgi:hypothetical protein
VALRPIPKARTRQPGPQALARVNERHWLAKDLAFIHSGFTPFIFGRPATDRPSALRSNALAGNANPSLNATRGWRPNGTNTEEFALGVNIGLPHTLVVWTVAASTAGHQPTLALRRPLADGVGGSALYAHNASGLPTARHVNSSSGGFNVTAGGGYEASRWMQSCGVFLSGSSRTAYGNGGFAATNTSTMTPVTATSSVHVAGGPYATADPASSGIVTGIALPMVINRALSAEEVQRLYIEQISNPWGIFAERPIWVPVSAAAGFRAAWVRRASQVIGAR